MAELRTVWGLREGVESGSVSLKDEAEPEEALA